MLRLWLLLILACAGALTPSRAGARGVENRTWDFFPTVAESRQESEPQVAGLHQGNLGCGYDIASGCCLAAESAGTQASEGIYEFTSASGKTYVGQSGDIAARLDQHLASGKLLEEDLSTVRTTEVLGGKTAREIAEQLRINELGGIDNLENIRNPIGPARQYLLQGNGSP
jgi:hypothetical protein